MLRIDRIPLSIGCWCIVLGAALVAADENDSPPVTTNATAAEVTTNAELEAAGADAETDASADADAPGEQLAKEGQSGEPAPSEPAPSEPAPSEPAHSEPAHSEPAHSEPAHGAGGDSHGGGSHDATDLGHQNSSGNMEDVMNFKTDLAIWTFVVFLCLLAILGKFAWGPIMEGLEKREQSIAAMIDEAKQSQEKAAAQLQQYEAKIAAAGEEAREIVAQARKDAEAAGERIVAGAEAAAEKQRERAVADIASAKNAALDEIKTEGVGIAVQLAGQIIRRELNAQDHTQLIDEALKQLPSRN